MLSSDISETKRDFNSILFLHPAVYHGCILWRGKKKITISEMMMLMVKRKHKITDDDQAGSSSTVGLLEEGIKEVLLFKIDIFFVLALLVFIF